MQRYSLEFLNIEDQDKCFTALLGNQERENHQQTIADFNALLGNHVDAYGAGRIPVIKYVGDDTWMVNLVRTTKAEPTRRVVQRCYVFPKPKHPMIAEKIEQLVQHSVIDTLNSRDAHRERNLRKLRHIVSTVDPYLPVMFSCETAYETQLALLERIEEKAEKASEDRTVAQHSTFLYLTKMLHFFQRRRVPLGAKKKA